MLVSELIAEILARADANGLPRVRLAEKAGIRPETLSRLRFRGDADFNTVSNLASAIGYRLALVPRSAKRGDKVFSPARIAREKAASRKRDEALIASGRASRAEIHRRNSFIDFSRAKFEFK